MTDTAILRYSDTLIQAVSCSTIIDTLIQRYRDTAIQHSSDVNLFFKVLYCTRTDWMGWAPDVAYTNIPVYDGCPKFWKVG